MSVAPAVPTPHAPVPSTVQNGNAQTAGAPQPDQVQKAGEATELSASPPAQIVSDIPGVATPAVSAVPAVPSPSAATASASASPTVNNLALRTGSPAATPPPTQASGIVKWRAHQSKPANTSQKVPIMDAPGPGTGAPAHQPAPASGFPSPGREQIHKLSKFVDDRTRITFGIQQSLPEAVRRAVRDNWKKCLIGSDFHQAFILNATIHHATPTTIRRGIEGFGKTMVSVAAKEIVDHMTAADLDKLAERILAKASNSFLDRALEMRLRTIEAKHLINALARAERLGYEPSDVQDDIDTPPSASVSAPTLPQTVVPTHQPGAPHSLSNVPPHCNLCLRRFFRDSAYEYHTKHKVCQRTPDSPAGFQFSCQHCGQGFINVSGLNYHYVHKQCGDSGLSPTAGQAASALTNPATVSTPTAAAKRSYTRHTPVTAQTPTPFKSRPATGEDPYAHLSQERMNALQTELDAAEAQYVGKMRAANALHDPEARRKKLDGLSNSFSTKQSLIRKKYGVRLRMRRSKEEVQAERERLSYRTAAELQAMGIFDHGHKDKGKELQATAPHQGPPGSQMIMSTPEPATMTLASSLAVPQTSSDVKDVSMGNNKRSYAGDGDSPSAKRIAYAEMGGLGGDDTVEAETVDPTMPIAAAAAATIFRNQDEHQGTEHQGAGSSDEPIMLDDKDIASSEGDDDDSSSSDEEEDVPAQLPTSVLQSLQQSTSTATASSRPGSS